MIGCIGRGRGIVMMCEWVYWECVSSECVVRMCEKVCEKVCVSLSHLIQPALRARSPR